MSMLLLLCVATILSDVNCMSEWFIRHGKRSHDEKKHRTASTLVECQKACEFDPRCVAVDWRSDGQECDLNTNPNHEHRSPGGAWDHYELTSHCNITPGQCFDSNVVANIKCLKTI